MLKPLAHQMPVQLFSAKAVGLIALAVALQGCAVKFNNPLSSSNSALGAASVSDTTPPGNVAVTLGSGGSSAGGGSVPLSVAASDTSSLTMCLQQASNCSGCTTFVPYSASPTFTFTGADGPKQLSVLVRDAGGNETCATSAVLTLDTVAPTGATVAIDAGAGATNQASVTITYAATDASSIDLCIQQAANCTGCTSFADGFGTTRPFTLDISGGFGPKTVSVAFKDAAGNITCQSDTINYASDILAPTAVSISINEGTATTQFLVTTVTLAATDPDLGTEMCVGAGATATDCTNCTYEAFSTTKVVAATGPTGTPGTKYINAKFKDALGNESGCATDDISYLPTTGTLTVGPRFTNAPNWNDYVRRCPGGTNTCAGIVIGPTGVTSTGPAGSGMPLANAVAVTGPTGASGGATAVVHGGDHRAVITTERSCVGLTAVDRLGAFDWTCAKEGGFATFYSIIKPTKGLADLVLDSGSQSAAGSWRNNAVIVTKTIAGHPTEDVETAETAWWTNPIRQLPDNVATCNTTDSGGAWSCGANGKTAILGPTGATGPTGIIFTSTLQAPGPTGSQGYNINADKISIVTIGSGALGSTTNSINCRNDTSEYSSTAGHDRCLISAGAQNFLWIEGGFAHSAGSVDNMVGMTGVNFSQVRRVRIRGADSKGIFVSSGSHYNRFSQLHTSGGSAGAFSLYQHSTGGSAWGNIIWDLNANGANDAVLIYGDTDYTVISNVVTTAANYGMYVSSDQYAGDGNVKMNVFSRLTVTDNLNLGIGFKTETDAPLSDNIVHNAVVTGTSSGGNNVRFSQGGTNSSHSRPTMSQIVSAHALAPTGSIYAENVTDGKFTGNLLVGSNAGVNCYLGSAGAGPPNSNPGFDTTTCAVPGGQASDHNLVAGVDLTNSFRLYATSDTANSAEDVLGQSTGNDIQLNLRNWFNFDNMYRAWIKFEANPWPHADYVFGCPLDATICQILDWSIKTTDNVIRDRTGNGSTANGTVVGGACPAEVAGTAFLTSANYTYNASYFSGLNGVNDADDTSVCVSGNTCYQRYMKSAVEVMGDDIGDEDGLCESGDACLYTPNFGAYQGHGTPTTCTFTDGTITGVTMYYHPTNGY